MGKEARKVKQEKTTTYSAQILISPNSSTPPQQMQPLFRSKKNLFFTKINIRGIDFQEPTVTLGK